MHYTKRGAVSIAALLLLISFRIQAHSTAQDLVSLSFKKGSLENVLKEIRKQTGYLYAFQDQWKGKAKPIDINVERVSVPVALDIIFRDQPFGYTIIGRTIVVKEKLPSSSRSDTVDNKHGPVKGMVYNETGEVLVGANVTIEASEKGTITNAEGEFFLPNVASNGTIIVSFVGYASQKVLAKEGTILKIYLKPASNELDKAVVQAYGLTTQRLSTGNISTVRAEDIAKQPVVNVLEAIQGQVPGAVVTNTGGYATSVIKIEIRGRNTINPNFSSDPLYIIDGVPLTILELTNNSNYQSGSQGFIQSGLPSPANGQSPFFSMDPNDIESIEVLKDADATAIYGSRGSNGVILVTTKKGKAGKTKLDLNVYQGVNENLRYYSLLNTSQYIAMRKEALNNDGLPIDANNAPDLVLWDTTRYTNWQKAMWGGVGNETNAQATLSGGDLRTTFRLSASYLFDKDILSYSGANKRGVVDFNLNHKSQNQRLNVGLTGSYSIVSTNQIFTPSAILLPPNAPPIFDSKGNLNYNGWTPLDFLFPFSSYLQPYAAKTNFLNSNLVINYEALAGLTLRASLGYNNGQTNQSSLIPLASQDPVGARVGTSTIGLSFVHNVIVEPQIEYNRFVGKGKLDVLVGASSQVNSTTSDYMSGSGYTNDALLPVLSAAPIPTIGTYGSQYKYAALFGRVNYNLENKYIINLNARRDGSSKFGPGRQYGNFGSIGVAWIFSEEDWTKNHLPVLSFGKLRGSYGLVGGDQILNYQFLSLWQYQRATYNNSLPLLPVGLTDSLLQWQVNRKLEAAIELGFFKDRLTMQLAWYRSRTNNQLVGFPTPEFSGFPVVTANSPADVQNQGFEFNANAKIFEQKRFRWTARFNIAINRNKLLAYPNLSQSPYLGTFFIGKSLGLRRVLHYTGIDPQLGAYGFQDRNHDGQITYDYAGRTADDSYLLDLTPRFDGGFSTDVALGDFELSVFFYFKSQLGGTAFSGLDAPGDQSNQPVEVLNHWQKPGDITVNPKFTTQPPQTFIDFQALSDGTIGDASFIRLQNVQLTYAVPAGLKKKAGLREMRLFVRGENLFVITHYKGLDPELLSFGSLPRPLTMVAGLSCEF